MAYKAYIDGVTDNAVPAENIFVDVRFEDVATSRTVRKQYKYVAGTTRAQFEAMILADRDALRALDNAKTVLVGAIGQEVT